MGWLLIVARREAIRLAVYDRRLTTMTVDSSDARAAAALWPLRRARRSSCSPACRRASAAALTLLVAGYTHVEIAAQLQMTQRTVERQLVRARATVRRRNAEYALATETQ